jgi:hypothetical protein
MRTARRHDNTHLDFVRGLPCCVCGDNTATEAAHIRYSDPRIAKPITGIGIKPDDRFVVPLCGRHHREQHQFNEREWWYGKVDPVLIALALFSVSGDHAAGTKIVEAALRI